MIFVMHLFFRRAWEARGGRRWPVRMVGYPYTAVLGRVLVTGIIATTWWASAMRPTILSGGALAGISNGHVLDLEARKSRATRRAARANVGEIATSMELTRCV
jgi:L-asparagine transporter-like permease